MMWVWQGSRVNSWLDGYLAGGWLMWCCCLVVEAEADADVVLLPGGGNWKLMLIWCCCLWWKLEAEVDLLLMVVAWISGAVQGPLGCADLLILLVTFPGWVSGYGVDTICGTSLDAGWSRLQRFGWKHQSWCLTSMFENWPVTQSSWHAQMKKKPIWLTVQNVKFSGWNTEFNQF